MNRICNYNLLRAKLHVKVLVNGNPFYFGRAIMSYRPLPIFDEFTRDREAVPADVVAASQRPHIFLDPATSQGGTLVLPFVWYWNALMTPFNQWSNMGGLSLRALQQLKHANGSLDSINITVFAWAEDIKLSIPTSISPVGMLPQSGDEYASGPISTPAHVVSQVAGSLSLIPSIKPYAKATQMLASGIGDMAKAFGFSRPMNVSPVQPFRPTYGSFANSNVPDTGEKLTLDVKQEVCVDSRVNGMDGSDEMTIRSISTRESYLTSFVWSVSSPIDTLLWNTYVNPVTARLNGAEYHLPACAFVSLPFKYWRGSMKYRFQIVSSGYHRGRLMFSYDPQVGASPEMNINYIHLVDISKDKDITVNVGWGTSRMFLQTAGITTSPLYSSTLLTSPFTDVQNGVLTVRVVNELTVPSDAETEIQINVFVSTGDDFELVEPTDCQISNLTWYKNDTPNRLLEPQSGEEVNTSEPVSSEETVLAEKLHGTHNIYDVTFGDPITSIRQVLKRYQAFEILYLPSNSGVFGITKFFRPDFPCYKATAMISGGSHNSGLSNYVNMTLLNWFTPAYVCRRGGLRWKYFSHSAAAGSHNNYQRVMREPCTNDMTDVVFAGPTALRDDVARFVYQLGSTSAGATFLPRANNPIIEADLPFYSKQRFYDGRCFNFTTDVTQSTFHSYTANSNGACTASSYCAAADDFNLSFFVGCPVLFTQTVP